MSFQVVLRRRFLRLPCPCGASDENATASEVSISSRIAFRSVPVPYLPFSVPFPHRELVPFRHLTSVPVSKCRPSRHHHKHALRVFHTESRNPFRLFGSSDTGIPSPGTTTPSFPATPPPPPPRSTPNATASSSKSRRTSSTCGSYRTP